jgi:hypothetical protein
VAEGAVLLGGLLRGGDRFGELGTGTRGLAIDQSDEQTGEVTELLVDDRAGDAGLGGDAVESKL